MLKKLVDRLRCDDRWISRSGTEAELVLQEPDPLDKREPGKSSGLRVKLSNTPQGGLVLRMEQYRDGRYPNGTEAVAPYWASSQTWVGRWSDAETGHQLHRLWSAATQRGSNLKAKEALHLMGEGE
jgi:hypothetical protein